MPVCYRHPGREAHIACQRCGRTICPDCMVDASVGFQCPSCVTEGRKSVREARTTYGGRRTGNPALTSFVLIGLNVVVWLAITLTGGSRSRLVEYLALTPVGRCGSVAQPGASYSLGSPQDCATLTLPRGDGVWFSGVADGAFWQLLTNAFVHVQPWHIVANMLALYFLGPQLEAVLGRARFLTLYLVSALAGSTLVFLTVAPATPTLGASGAVFGMLGGLMVAAYKAHGDVRALLPWLLINAVITFVVPGISWQGHVGGFVGGTVVAAALVYAPRGPRRTPFQVGATVAVVVVLAVAIVVRTVVLA